jgi:erythrin-vacuolar iron transport family protein
MKSAIFLSELQPKLLRVLQEQEFERLGFRDLNEAQILALAITAEEEDARIYRDFAESLRADFPATAELFTKMAAEEDGHRHRLIELYRQRFGEHIPLIRRQDVKGFVVRRPSWFTRRSGPSTRAKKRP